VILPERVLFVGAHCDDIELFAGGLLAELCYRRTHQLGVLVFSDHRGVVSDATATLAREEFAGNLAFLSADSGARLVDHTSLLLPACRGAFEAERGQIYAALEGLRNDYDLVVTHAASDTNQDHAQVAAEAARVFKAHATLLGGEFPSNDLGGFTPQVFVALSGRALSAKVRLISAYSSQRFGDRPYFDEGAIRGLARVRGSQLREEAAEAFTVMGRVIVRT
jgi:LmbE family N-acetylglucosaminyl deacetylase